uniref:DUF148 domain-containing protein n=1 Tax=Panagrellus redivivus TaxID=6233 RepID=A0A7E4V6S6_PANRE
MKFQATFVFVLVAIGYTVAQTQSSGSGNGAEVSQWTSNLTSTVDQVLEQLGSIVAGLSPEAQGLFNTVRNILTNGTLNGNDQCANILNVFGSAPTNVLSELFTAVPVLGNLCTINIGGGLLGGLVGGLVALLLGLVDGLVGGLLGGITGGGLGGGIVGGVGGAVSGIVNSLGL